MPDEIISELWQIKYDMAREHGHDVRALATHLQVHEDLSHLHTTETNGETELFEPQRTVGSENMP